MKTTIFLGLMLAGFQALAACPDLSGRYSDDDSSEPFVITQTETKSVTTYVMGLVTVPKMSIVADGVTRKTVDKDAQGTDTEEHTYKCDADKLVDVYSRQILNADGSVYLQDSGQTTMSLDAAKSLVITTVSTTDPIDTEVLPRRQSHP